MLPPKKKLKKRVILNLLSNIYAYPKSTRFANKKSANKKHDTFSFLMSSSIFQYNKFFKKCSCKVSLIFERNIEKLRKK